MGLGSQDILLPFFAPASKHDFTTCEMSSLKQTFFISSYLSALVASSTTGPLDPSFSSPIRNEAA
jgi:hypothetical protein